MSRPVITFTDFGHEGPYLGEMRVAILNHAPGVSVIDLMADAPAFDPMASGYLLAALLPRLPASAVVLAVVDPGVGGAREAMVAEADGRLLVGPENGLFEPALRRANSVGCWRIVWRPDHLSATFHGRDLFAPIAARLALGNSPEKAGCEAMAWPRRPDWPDELARVIYIDRYGNCVTGLRAQSLPADARIGVAGLSLAPARTFSDMPAGNALWYENSSGLVEIAVARGSAASELGLAVGSAVEFK